MLVMQWCFVELAMPRPSLMARCVWLYSDCGEPALPHDAGRLEIHGMGDCDSPDGLAGTVTLPTCQMVGASLAKGLEYLWLAAMVRLGQWVIFLNVWEVGLMQRRLTSNFMVLSLRHTPTQPLEQILAS